jgi:hypothetical protein
MYGETVGPPATHKGRMVERALGNVSAAEEIAKGWWDAEISEQFRRLLVSRKSDARARGATAGPKTLSKAWPAHLCWDRGQAG